MSRGFLRSPKQMHITKDAVELTLHRVQVYTVGPRRALNPLDGKGVYTFSCWHGYKASSGSRVISVPILLVRPMQRDETVRLLKKRPELNIFSTWRLPQLSQSCSSNPGNAALISFLLFI